MIIAKNLGLVLAITMLFSPVVTFSAELIIKVTDEGAPVSMAEIYLINSDDRTMINNDFTNKKGVYQYTVKPGSYDIKVIKELFSDVTINSVEVKQSNIKKNVKLILHAFSSDETVEKSDDDCE